MPGAARVNDVYRPDGHKAGASKGQLGGMRTIILALIALMLAAPFAAAQNDTDVDPPNEIDIDITDNRGDSGADESVFLGLSTTVVIILIVLAVLVVALIVAMASRP